MMQIWFLLVLLNLLSGLILVYAEDIKNNLMILLKQESREKSDNILFFNTALFKLILGFMSVAIGLISLIAVEKDSIPVLENLIPSFTCLASGCCLVLHFYNLKQDELMLPVLPDFLFNFFFDYKKIIGIASIAAGLIHFIVPSIMFL
ncbi:MAG: hypothetical protein K6F69_09025 [Treponema sp.]|nr:hypothetical protein [Treponema sp.]